MIKDKPRSAVPGWYQFAWFLGRPPSLTHREWRILGLVAAVSFFETYDLYLFTLNLKQIQADFGIAESELGLFGSFVRAGALFAIFPAMAADRVGRRKMLLITIVAYTILTGLTAFSPTAEVFAGLQFLARGFAVAETILATVVIVEEFGPAHRGWGLGAAAAIQATGAGFASAMFGVVDFVPYGWRSLYLVGLVPLALIAYWRRALPETTRFAEQQQRAPMMGVSTLQNILALGRAYPKRFLALSSAVFFTSMAIGSATFFAPKYLQDVHGWTPGNVALMSFMGGALAIVGNPLAGWLSDRYGRRPITALFALCLPVAAMLMYNVTGAWLPVVWVALIFFSLGTGVMESAYSAEMFPTEARATAASSRALMSTLGGSAGLAAISLMYGVVGSNWSAITMLASACFLVPVIVLLAFPETAGRNLEDIAPSLDRKNDNSAN